ncbi:hypothetical protein NQ318_017127 [Aromia moschata]|uniref:Uncharacterized protein n=1 Tax=Aromia moschata TaxID=1265417 RepID=A0AAV8X9A9_9CUCU|nr:hypothetical protein NQ318_017127 [Aromia moschata]
MLSFHWGFEARNRNRLISDIGAVGRLGNNGDVCLDECNLPRGKVEYLSLFASVKEVFGLKRLHCIRVTYLKIKFCSVKEVFPRMADDGQLYAFELGASGWTSASRRIFSRGCACT